MKVVLLAFIVSVAAGHEHGDHEHGDHEHKNHHHHLRGTHRPITMPGHRCNVFAMAVDRMGWKCCRCYCYNFLSSRSMQSPKTFAAE